MAYESIEMPNIQSFLYSGIPEAEQRRVVDFDPNLRLLFNPKAQELVMVHRATNESTVQGFRMADAKVMGWMPMPISIHRLEHMPMVLDNLRIALAHNQGRSEEQLKQDAEKAYGPEAQRADEKAFVEKRLEELDDETKPIAEKFASGKVTSNPTLDTQKVPIDRTWAG